MLEFLKSREDFVGHLLRHLGTAAIMDLLLRLVTCIESTECQQQCLQVHWVLVILLYRTFDIYKFRIVRHAKS